MKSRAKVLGMARQKLLVGRPSHGPRDAFNIRVPEAMGDQIRDIAAERGVTFNDVICEVLGTHFGVAVPAPRPRRQQHEDTLPLSA